jgi:DNA repair protein REV1
MSSSDYFGDDDPDFLEYISTTNFPGDEVMEGVEQAGPSTPKKRKRSRSPSFNLLQEDEDEEFPSSPSKAPVSAPSYTDAEAYGVTKFGGWGDYMRKKRAKLQIQNSEITAEGAETKPQIFKGLQIYVRLPFSI